MLQYATFLPVMRSHGTDTPREPWRFGDAESPFYKCVLDCIKLRYKLLPYTYSLAADVTFGGGTMMRPLAFDYAGDEAVLDVKDEQVALDEEKGDMSDGNDVWSGRALAVMA